MLFLWKNITCLNAENSGENRRRLYRSAVLGKDATGRLKQKNSPLPFLLANAHVASLRPLGIHKAEH